MIYFWEVCCFLHPTSLLCCVFIAVHDRDVLQHLVHVGDVRSVIAQRLFRCLVIVPIQSIHTVIYACVVQVKLVKSQ